MSGRVALTERFARSAEAGGRKSPIFYDEEVICFGLPPIEKDDIRLVCWLGVLGDPHSG